MTRYLVRCMPWHEERYEWACALRDELDGELVEDTAHDGYITTREAFIRQGTDDAWHFEDDVVLTEHFRGKAAMEQMKSGGRAVIQAFDGYMLPKDCKPSWSRTFIGTQCFFIPGRYARSLADYFPVYLENYLAARTRPHLQPFDYAIQDWLAVNGLRCWLASPSLVDHRAVDSVIHPTRKEEKQSLTFIP